MDWSQIDDPNADLNTLEERRRLYQQQLQDLREEITDIERLNSEASDFETEAKEQEARLVSVGLITPSGDAPLTVARYVRATYPFLCLQLHKLSMRFLIFKRS